MDRKTFIAAVAEKLHDAWRAPRRRADGTYEPRLKATADTAWSGLHGGVTELDIANTDYRDLPADWQHDNRASAEVAADAVLAADGVLTDAWFEDAAAAVHVAWLERHRDWAPPEQQLPYPELSEAEKDKDRAVVRAAVSVYRAHR